LSQAEFYGARSMLVMLEDKSSGLEHRVRAARIALKRWVGDVGDAPLAAPPNIDRIRLRSAALEGDLARHPRSLSSRDRRISRRATCAWRKLTGNRSAK